VRTTKPTTEGEEATMEEEEEDSDYLPSDSEISDGGDNSEGSEDD